MLPPPIALQELVPVEVVGALTEVADEFSVEGGEGGSEGGRGEGMEGRVRKGERGG